MARPDQFVIHLSVSMNVVVICYLKGKNKNDRSFCTIPGQSHQRIGSGAVRVDNKFTQSHKKKTSSLSHTLDNGGLCNASISLLLHLLNFPHFLFSQIPLNPHTQQFSQNPQTPHHLLRARHPPRPLLHRRQGWRDLPRP